jgi:DNA-binding GntR family transcriptional regulator
MAQYEKPVGLTDWAYERIKESILNLNFLPGAQLQIDHLAIQMEISRTPIREALLRLERDGLVRVVPRVGFFVAEITRRDLEELYEIRELLESRAIKDSVENLTDQDLDNIDEILRQGAAAVEENNVDKFRKAEIDFHNYLTDHSNNRRLISILESYQDLTYRWRTLSLRSEENLRLSLSEHQEIARAVRQGDAELAHQLMSEHICKARDRILGLVDLLKVSTENEVNTGLGWVVKEK